MAGSSREATTLERRTQKEADYGEKQTDVRQYVRKSFKTNNVPLNLYSCDLNRVLRMQSLLEAISSASGGIPHKVQVCQMLK